MSVVRRYTPEEVAKWEARGPEPFVVDDLRGWIRHDYAGQRDRLLPNERLITFERGATRAHVMRWWDYPLHPGNPMAIATTRPVTVDGRELELHRTRVFEGSEWEVLVVFIPNRDWHARIVLENASDEDVDAVLGAFHFAT